MLLDTPFGRVVVELPRSAVKIYRAIFTPLAEIDRLSHRLDVIATNTPSIHGEHT